MLYSSLNIDLLPINIAIYKKESDNFIIMKFNKYAEATEKITRDELIGRKLTDVFPMVKKFGLFDVLLRVEATGKTEVLDTYFYQDARIGGWRHYTVVKLEDGSVAAFYEDKSQEKKREEEYCEIESILAYKTKIFHHLIDNSESISVQGYNEEHKVIYWNKASELLYGYTKEEALGKELESLIIPDPMKQEASHLIDNWIRHAVPIPPSKITLMDKEGNDVHVFSQHIMIKIDEEHYEMYCIDIDLGEVDMLQKEILAQKIY